MNSKEILQPEFISIPPKPKDVNGLLEVWKQTYYPLEYLLEYGMRRFEDEKPKEGAEIVYTFAKSIDRWTYYGQDWVNIDKWCYATEYDQAKEKQEQYGRLKGAWERTGDIRFLNRELNIRLDLAFDEDVWVITDRKSGLIEFLCYQSFCTYEMVNNFLEMYETINRKEHEK